MNQRLYSVAGLILALILFVGVILFSQSALRSARVDLTENHLYTLSDGSLRVAGGLSEPVRLRFYFSARLSGKTTLRDYARRVQELLEEYAQVSKGKIQLEVIDPEPFSDAEEAAVAAGVQSVEIPGTGDRLFFGLVGTNTTDGQEVVPFFDPRREPSLEYDVTRLVYKLAHPEKKVVGLMSSLPVDGGPPSPFAQQGQQPWFAARQLHELYDVRSIEPSATSIPAEVDVLVLVHPKSLPDATLYALDQFVLRGGRLLVFVDPNCRSDESGSDPSNPFSGMNVAKNSDLARLFQAWGMELVPDKVVADRKSAITVSAPSARGGEEPVPFVVYLQLGPDNMNSGDVVTSDLADLKMGMAGALQQKEGSGFEFISLLQTSDEAQLVDESKLRFYPRPQDFLKDYKPDGKAYTLAARLRGRFASAFPEGKPAAPPPVEGEEPPPAEPEDERPQLTEAADTCNVIVVADVDMLSDPFWVQVQEVLGSPMGYVISQNFDFLVYCIENLSGSNELLGIPSRKEFERPFERVDAMEQAAQEQFQARTDEFTEQLHETQNKLRQLNLQDNGGGELVLSPEQKEEIRKLQEDELRLQRELRNVNLELNRDVQSLGLKLKVINIGLVPLAVFVGALGVWGYGQRRRARR